MARSQDGAGLLQQALSFHDMPQARFAHSQGCLDFPHFGLYLEYLVKLRRGTGPVTLKKPHHSHVGSSIEIGRIQRNHSLEFASAAAKSLDWSAFCAFCRWASISSLWIDRLETPGQGQLVSPS